MSEPRPAPPLVFEDWVRDVVFLLGQLKRDCSEQAFRGYAHIYLLHYRELLDEGKVPSSDKVDGVLRHFESMTTA